MMSIDIIGRFWTRMTNAGQGPATHDLGSWLRRLQRNLKHDSGVFTVLYFSLKAIIAIP